MVDSAIKSIRIPAIPIRQDGDFMGGIRIQSQCLEFNRPTVGRLLFNVGARVTGRGLAHRLGGSEDGTTASMGASATGNVFAALGQLAIVGEPVPLAELPVVLLPLPGLIVVVPRRVHPVEGLRFELTVMLFGERPQALPASRYRPVR